MFHRNKGKIFLLLAAIVIDWVVFDGKYRKALVAKMRGLKDSTVEWFLSHPAVQEEDKK